MYQKKREQQVTWFLCVVLIHALFLFFLFFSYITQPLLQHKKLAFMNFKVPAPVIFYGTPLVSHARPGTLSVQKGSLPASSHAVALQESSLVDKEKQKNILSQDGFARKQIQKKQQQVEPKHDQKPSVSPNKPEVIKKPTLADVFNHARSTFAQQASSNLRQDGDGAGQPLIIKEGDIRYYNLWKTFLEHLNDHARFNRARKSSQVQQWLQEKKIKNNLQCAITINKKGELLSVEIMQSSGYQPFDALCLDDVRSASAYPPLPDHLHKQTACFEVKSYF